MTHPVTGGEYVAQPSQVEHLKEAGWEPDDPDAEYERWPADLQRYGGLPEVLLRHPETGGEYGAPESAVPYHREKGWVRVEAETEADLKGKTVAELQDLARAQGLKVSGTKDELLARLGGEADQDDNEAGVEPAQDTDEEA